MRLATRGPILRSASRSARCLARVVCLLLLWVCAASLARAQTYPRYGEQGQFDVFGNACAAVAFGGDSGGELTTRDIAVGVTPGARYFALRDLALGVALDSFYVDAERTQLPYTELQLGLSLGLGFNIPLSERVSLFPEIWATGGYSRFRPKVDLPDPNARAFPDPNARAFNDPAFLQSMPQQDAPSDFFVRGELRLPLHLQLAAATYVSVGPSVRLGTRGLRLLFSAGIGSFF